MTLSAHAVGIGLRRPHYRQVILAERDRLQPVTFVEVHSENFFGSGGAALNVLEQVREHCELSLHGVGLGLGNAVALNTEHLRALKVLAQHFKPALVSEHMCWNATAEATFNDLLPLPYTQESLLHLCAHIDESQDFLQRRILIENASAYLQFAGDEYDEFSFIAEAAKRTGCGILLDLNNLYVNAKNVGTSLSAALETLASLPDGTIGEIHLAGHLSTEEGLLIDNHGSSVSDPVWKLYQETIATLGPCPTLIEWDTQIPALEVLLQEANTAHGFLDHSHA
jgi:uncharacterized protein (UPF0276 family)